MEDSEENKWEYYSMIFISTLRIPSILVNLIGLICLYHQKRRKHIQKTLLVHVSLIEIFLVMAGLLLTTIVIYHWTSNEIYHRMAVALVASSNFMFYAIMFIITIDRLLCILLHIKYSYYITPIRVHRLLLAARVCALVIFVGVKYC